MPVTRRSSTVGTTAAQTSLRQSFRVKKNSTTTGKELLVSPVKVVLTENSSPRKRRSIKQGDGGAVQCSPVKKAKPDEESGIPKLKISLSKYKKILGVSEVENVKENDSKSQKVSRKKSVRGKKGKAVVLKDVRNNESDVDSPTKENVPNISNFDKKEIVTKSMKDLNLSPRVHLIREDPYHMAATKARALDFSSPNKSNRTVLGSVVSNVACVPSGVTLKSSPLKPDVSVGSPAKRNIFGTPRRSIASPISKDSEVKSPVREVFKTPTRTAPRSPAFRTTASPARRNLLSESQGSPRRAIFTSPTREIRQSPRKNHSNPYASASESPRRPLFASPTNDVRQSPRKNFTNPYSSPCIRLAKQEGECYVQAKQALHTALPDRLLCREKELSVVQQFIDKHVHKGAPGSMYISGAPGTGKTAVLSHTMKQIQEIKKCPIVYVNCMACANPCSIYNKVLSELKNKSSALSAKEANTQLIKTLTSQGPNVVLILDEVDQLDTKNQEVLYNMFEWPALTNSRLILIGIANSLDLTDRILPRLQARPKCKPTLLNFTPYSKDQLVTILTDRLSKVEYNGQPVMEPTAVQFCARKVAAVAGDMRKALDICRRAVEMVEGEVRKQQILKATTGCNSPYKDSFKSPSKPKPPTIKKITVAHIAKIVGEVYGSRVTAANQKQGIPLQEKLALCTLLMILKSGKAKEIQLGKLHETYVKVCKQQQVSGHADLSEFMSMCMLSEAKGVVTLKKSKDPRSAKVSLKLDEKEFEHALQDKVLMSAILKKGLP